MTNKTVMFYALLLISGALCAMDGSASSASVAPTASEQHAALITDIRDGATAQVQTFVEHGADIHANYEEAVRSAQTSEIADYLCEHGGWHTRFARHWIGAAAIGASTISLTWWLTHKKTAH